MMWFRFYHETIRDRKIEMAAASIGMTKTEMVGCWSTILCLASESPNRGVLLVTLHERYSVLNIAHELKFDEKKTAEVLDALIRYEMLDLENGTYFVKNWSKRQFSSDSSAERVKKYREKKNPKKPVTPTKRYSNGPDTESDTDTNKDSVDPALQREWAQIISQIAIRMPKVVNEHFRSVDVIERAGDTWMLGTDSKSDYDYLSNLKDEIGKTIGKYEILLKKE